MTQALTGLHPVTARWFSDRFRTPTEAQLRGWPEIRSGSLNLRAAVRTGDTTSSQRQAMVRRPPHILVTTPESLYNILTSSKAKQMLRAVETVIEWSCRAKRTV